MTQLFNTQQFYFIFYFFVLNYKDVPSTPTSAVVKQVYNPFAIERPHATPSMLERQGSFRGFNQLNQASPFKRQHSLRVNDLPSNLERTRSHSLEPTDFSRLPTSLGGTLPHGIGIKPPGNYFFYKKKPRKRQYLVKDFRFKKLSRVL